MGKEKMRDRENTEFTGKEERERGIKLRAREAGKRRKNSALSAVFAKLSAAKTWTAKRALPWFPPCGRKFAVFHDEGINAENRAPPLTTVVCARGINAVCSAIINTEYQIRGIWNVIITQT